MCAINVVPRGLEPQTLRLLAVRSNQLSYETDAIPLCELVVVAGPLTRNSDRLHAREGER